MPAIGQLDVSTLALGCNNFGQRCDRAESAGVVGAALDAGITFFDTADIYGDTQSEVFLGQALASNRDRVVIGTKFGLRWGRVPGGARPAEIRRAVEASLTRLGTDRIDLYQLHFPGPPGLPEAVPVVDILAVLTDLVDEGKVVEIGCANFTGAQLSDAGLAAGNGARFVSLQNEYSLLCRDAETDALPVCRELGVSFLPYYPLASGLLTGKYSRHESLPDGSRLAAGWTAWAGKLGPQLFDFVERLQQFAADRNHSLLELALSWLLVQDGVECLTVGCRTPEQVRVNAASLGWRLGPADLAELSQLLDGDRAVDPVRL